MKVSRYHKTDPITGMASGDFLRVGDTDLGSFRDLAHAEFKRAGSAFGARPMWYTGSPFGKEIMELVREVRG